MPSDFPLNRYERAELTGIIRSERSSREGKELSTESINRALRRIDEGIEPRGPTERAALAEIYETDGLILYSSFDPGDEWEVGEDIQEEQEISQRSAKAARFRAEDILAENAAEVAAAARHVFKPSDSVLVSKWIIEVEITRINEGETATYYNPFEGEPATETATSKLDAFYLLTSSYRTLKRYP